jgi:quercetin dioxygenase-like cupin family protein
MAQARVFKFGQIPTVPRGGGVETRPLVEESVGASNITSGITTFPPGAAIRLHSHNTEEMVTILEGEGTVEVEGRQTELGRYDTTFVPPGLFHRFINRGDSLMRILWVYGSTHVTRTFADTGETVEHLSEQDKGGTRQ